MFFTHTSLSIHLYPEYVHVTSNIAIQYMYILYIEGTKISLLLDFIVQCVFIICLFFILSLKNYSKLKYGIKVGIFNLNYALI